ncbi:transcription factor nrm1 whi5 [Pyrenophora seminiperda CCB06]|uniref:Transcription factor nrm1 whi5 n=1 Tax=Pyrenophora seminiperda CCB06 TaxID=1302712 RepID=A0A3M7MBM1_9PLEO|nr:transcription factor nrm1 whi5 [Pyrenophora seminiperda CCB06]
MSLKNFDPDAFFAAWSDEKFSPLDSGKTLMQCICESFGIDPRDDYVYRAMAETSLLMMQKAIAAGGQHKMHDWYHDEKGELLTPSHPTPTETTLYTTLFAPPTSLPPSLRNLAHNAKPTSLRHAIGTHLLSLFHPSPDPLLPKAPSSKSKSKSTKTSQRHNHKNPYYTLWTYSCHALEWAGPTQYTRYTKFSHHILPVFYHHFGCVVPSYAALYVISKLACTTASPSSSSTTTTFQPILDIGSGNGYWTYMLRHFDLSALGIPPTASTGLQVRAIDTQDSEYRVSWISDTIVSDGKQYLEKNNGGQGCILLLVYPQATTDFTGPVMRAYEGNTIVVAGTQCRNGFTGFSDVVVDEWVEGNLPAFELALRMPLPSFAGKDDALFVFQRRK